MTKRLISFLIALCIFIAIPLSARYKYNPFTRKLDYYETGADIDLGDLADVTLTGMAALNLIYRNPANSAWVNLPRGADGQYLTTLTGAYVWQNVPAGATTFVALTDTPINYVGSNSYMVRVNAGANALVFGAEGAIDHDGLTNWAANKHVVLPGTIANVLSDHTLLVHTTLGLFDQSSDVDHDLTTNYVAAQHRNPAKVFYVSATGGDYTTIQAALNAQTAGGETFLVGPGTYTDTISFTASDQVVKPLGHVANVIVTQADANIVDGGAFTDCLIEGIELRLTAPTTAINLAQVGTGILILIECRGYLATAVALAQADQPSLVGFTDAGAVRIKRGNYQYYHTGNTGGGGIKVAFKANFNLASLHLHKIDVVTITNSGTALVSSLFTTTGTAVTEMHNCIDITITDPDATYVVGLGYIGGGGAHNVQGNHVDVVAANNTSIGIWHNGTATVRSSFNAIHASDVAGSSYAFNIGASATLDSHFDDLRSDNGNSNSGTLNMVSSQTDGDFTVTNAFVYDRVTDHNLLVGYLAGEDLTATEGQYNTLVGEEAGKNITTGDNNDVFGYQAAFFNQTGQQNVVIGSEAGYGVTENSYFYDVIIGYRAGYSITEAEGNVFIGHEAAFSIEAAEANVAIGMGALYTLTDGAENVVIGRDAGNLLRGESSENTYVGYSEGYGLGSTTEENNYNVGVGKESLLRITDGEENTAVGYRSADALTTADYNVAVGSRASFQNQTGVNNVVVGAYAGYGIISNSYSNNVIIGYQAAEDITTGSLNVVIGYMAGEGWLTTQDDQFVVANTDTATPLLHGDFTTGDLASASLTHNSDHKVMGYNRSDTIEWNDCFDHGSTAAKYGQDWNLTALHTQGAGSNTIQTNPGNITLTTDNDAIGDNEGTRTDYQMVDRASRARSDFGIHLGQTANTQFYCGWNTSGTNAMVAAADEYVIVFFDVSDNANWQIKVGDGATEDVFTSGVAGAAAFVRHEIWVESDGTVHWVVNGTELDITGSVNNLMTANDHYLIVGQAQSVTGAAVIVAEIGYVEHEKLKDH